MPMENHKFYAETMRQTCKTPYKSHQARNPQKNPKTQKKSKNNSAPCTTPLKVCIADEIHLICLASLTLDVFLEDLLLRANI